MSLGLQQEAVVLGGYREAVWLGEWPCGVAVAVPGGHGHAPPLGMPFQLIDKNGKTSRHFPMITLPAFS